MFYDRIAGALRPDPAAGQAKAFGTAMEQSSVTTYEAEQVALIAAWKARQARPAQTDYRDAEVAAGPRV